MSAIKSKSLTLQAKSFSSRGEINKAIELLLEAISYNPNNFEAFSEIANCYRKNQDYINSIDFYKKALALNNNIDILFELAETYFIINDFNNSEEIYKDCLKINSKYIKAIKGLSFLYFTKKEYEKAEKGYHKYLTLKKLDLDSIIKLSEIYCLQNNFNLALMIINDNIKILKNNTILLNRLAEVYYEKGDYSKSIKILEDLTKKEPNNTDILFNLAKIYFKNLNFDKSLELLNRHLTLKKNADIYFYIFLNAEKLNNIELAENSINNAIALDLNNFDYWYKSAILKVKQEKYIEAINSFEKVLQKESLSIDKKDIIKKSIADIYLKLDNHEKALYYYLKITTKIDNYELISLNIANIYDSKKELNNALVFYENYLLKYDKDIKILEKVANIYFDKNNYLKSIDLFNKIIIYYKDENFNSEYYKNIDADNDISTESKIKALEEQKNIILYKIGECHFYLDEYKEALLIFEKFYNEKILDLDFILKLQKIYYNLEFYEKAIYLNEKALEQELNEFSKLAIFNNLANLYLKLKNYNNSVKYINLILEKDPKNFYANFYLGSIYLEQKEFKKAEEFLLKANEIKADFTNLYKLGLCLIENNKEDKAKDIFQDLIKKFSENYLPYYGMALAFYKEKNYNKAILLLNKTIKEKKCDLEIYLKLAEIYDYLDMDRNSNEILEEALKIFPNNLELMLRVGKIKLNKNDFEEAYKIFDKLEENNNNPNEELLENLMICSYKLENFNRASELIDKILVLNNNNIKAMVYKGLIYSNEGNSLKAVEIIQEAISLDHKNKNSLLALAEVYENDKRYEDALWTYQRIIAFIPDDFISFKGISDCYFKLNNFPMAIKSYAIALELNPTHYEMLLNMGISYVETDQLTSAIKTFEDYIKKQPLDYTAFAIIANTYYKRDDTKKAIEYIEKYLISELEPNGEYLSLAGDIYLEIQNEEKALNFYHKAIDKNYFFAFIKLGNLYYDLNKYDQSYNIFYQFLKSYPDSYDSRILYVTLAYITDKFGEKEKEIYSNVIDKAAEYLDPNYLFTSKKWTKGIILKVQEIVKKV
ncbi:MAG: tetratricopeptide repeat protein [Candidatus Sericytochromatia bacterium]